MMIEVIKKRKNARTTAYRNASVDLAASQTGNVIIADKRDTQILDLSSNVTTRLV